MHDHLVGLGIVLEPEEMDYSEGSYGNANKNNDANTRKSIFTLSDTSVTNFPPSSKVISKFGVIKAVPLSPSAPPSSPRSHSYKERGGNFNERCCYCRQIMSPSFDVYMYMGERGFCSSQCRYEYVFWEEKVMKTSGEDSFLSTLRPESPTWTYSASSESATSSSGSKNKGKGKAHK